MNEIVNRPAPGLPADFASRLSSGIAESRASTVIAGGGKPLLRMLKSGEWVFGQGNEEVQEGSRWVVNVMQLAHGWTCWSNNDDRNAKNELLGEVMAPIYEPKPVRPSPINGQAFSEQRTFDAICYDGDDEGTEVLHKVSSIGGMRAVDELLIAVQRQLQTDPAHPCPVIELSTDHYEHKKWGRIYTPVFSIVGWSDMIGNLAGGPDPAVGKAAPKVDSKPTRMRKPAVQRDIDKRPDPHAEAEQVAEAEAKAKGTEPPFDVTERPEPQATAQTHTGQRRRPVAR